MRCPYCFSTNLRVIDTRMKGDIVRRKRKCKDCGGTFYTIEIIDLSEMMVKKRSGILEKFSRVKIINGLHRAFNKLDISEEVINNIIADVELEIYRKKKNVISSEEIGNIILEHLKKINLIAYLRFLSVYKRFKSIEDLYKEIEKLLKQKKS